MASVQNCWAHDLRQILPSSLRCKVLPPLLCRQIRRSGAADFQCFMQTRPDCTPNRLTTNDLIVPTLRLKTALWATVELPAAARLRGPQPWAQTADSLGACSPYLADQECRTLPVTCRALCMFEETGSTLRQKILERHQILENSVRGGAGDTSCLVSFQARCGFF